MSRRTDELDVIRQKLLCNIEFYSSQKNGHKQETPCHQWLEGHISQAQDILVVVDMFLKRK